jgi:Malectin domain
MWQVYTRPTSASYFLFPNFVAIFCTVCVLNLVNMVYGLSLNEHIFYALLTCIDKNWNNLVLLEQLSAISQPKTIEKVVAKQNKKQKVLDRNKSGKNMKCVMLILILATNANAFEQIYAINCGASKNHTDSDGITYQPHMPRGHGWGWTEKIDIGEVPESDRYIYNQIDNTYNITSSLKYEIPLKNDGIYLLIAKFSSGYTEGFAAQRMTLNNEIQLDSNVDLFKLCGGKNKICDEYIYFCISEKTMYFNNQSVVIQDEKINIEILPVKNRATLAGLVLLKGKLGESQNLVASAKKEHMFFDPMKMNPMCSTTAMMLNEILKIQEEQRQSTKKLQTSVEINSENNVKIIKDSCSVSKSSLQSVQRANELAVKSLKQLQTDNSDKLQKTLNRLNENSLRNISNLNAVVQSSFESVLAASDNSQAAILREIQSLKNQKIADTIRLENVEKQVRSYI